MRMDVSGSPKMLLSRLNLINAIGNSRVVIAPLRRMDFWGEKNENEADAAADGSSESIHVVRVVLSFEILKPIVCNQCFRKNDSERYLVYHHYSLWFFGIQTRYTQRKVVINDY